MTTRIQKSSGLEQEFANADSIVRLDDDKWKASKAEIHFHYAFHYTLQQQQQLLKQTSTTKFKSIDAEYLLGNDGHLIFQRPIESIELTHVPSVQSTMLAARTGKHNATTAATITTPTTTTTNTTTNTTTSISNNYTGSTQLPLSLTADGVDVSLGQVMIRMYSHGIGILRFAIECGGSGSISGNSNGKESEMHAKMMESLSRLNSSSSQISKHFRLQTLLNIQNSVMRTASNNASPKRLQVNEKGGYDFLPGAFIESLLNATVGPKGIAWQPDQRTDRLAVYTLAAFDCSSIASASPVEMKAVTYKLGQMEDSASSPLDKSYIEDFYSQHVYSRFASPTGGIFTTFHIDGGATLFFCNNGEALGGTSINEAPVLHSERQKKPTKCFGTNRPLVAMSIFEPYLFHRLFLRWMDHSLHDLITEGKPSRSSLDALKRTHLTNLQYKAMFLSKDISSTRAGKEQFQMHLDVGQLPQLYQSLSDTITQMYSFFSSVEERQAQARLDSLTMVFGVLGLAGLVLNFYSYYLSLAPDVSAVHRVIPALIDAFMLLLTVVYIYRMRYSQQ